MTNIIDVEAELFGTEWREGKGPSVEKRAKRIKPYIRKWMAYPSIADQCENMQTYYDELWAVAWAAPLPEVARLGRMLQERVLLAGSRANFDVACLEMVREIWRTRSTQC